MRKLTLFLSIFIIIGLTSMISSDVSQEKQGLSDHPDQSVLKQQSQATIEKGMVTIKVKKGIEAIPAQKGKVIFNAASLDQLSEEYEIQSIENRFRYNPSKMRQGLPDLSRIYKITFSENISPYRVSKAFSKDPNIEYAEPIPVNFPCEMPDDPYYYKQHFLPQIQAEEAWSIHKGEDGSEVVVGIMDTGVDWHHEDLTENIWQNLGEDADGDGQVLVYDGSEWTFDPDDENGIDDDGNGYPDDFIGWDFYNDNNDPYPEPGEDHGTHCAGLAAARTNNGTGVAGISWNLKILPIEDPSFGDAYQGIIYAAENGADIVSNSWAGTRYSTANYESVQYAIGLGSIVVASAGNDNQYLVHHYPSGYPGVISVAAVSKTDIKASYSNFGPNVTICAPGGEGSANGLYSTTPNNGYNWKAGTSMASPVMAGLLGLVMSYNPEWSNEEVITQVLTTTDNIDSLNPNFINKLGTGRINAFKALSETGGEIPQEIKMDIISSFTQDLDNDGLLAPGDTLTFDLVLQNFSLNGIDPAAVFQISCNDPYIEVYAGTHTDTILPDDYIKLTQAFQVIVLPDSPTHDVEFCITVSSELPIIYGDTLFFEEMVAPAGIIVYRGEGSGNAYSGQYIQNFLTNNWKDCYYTTEMPSQLKGFDVAFMSLGNYGYSLGNGTWANDHMCEAIINYLEDGGKLYLECGSLFGILAYMNSPLIPELKELLSIADFETPMISNSIDTLTGLEGSMAEGLYFTGTSQDPYWYIDILTPDENGTSMLEENDYGVVAVQGEGEFGQKTILMNYAISKLQAGEPGMTQMLMLQVCNYFGIDINTGLEELVSGSRFQVSGYPNPTSGIHTIRFTLDKQEYVSIKVYDMMGNLVEELPEQGLPAGEQELKWNSKSVDEGIYFCKVQIGNEIITKKIIKIN